ncbi:alginate lyase family protein [Petrimonas sp.]|uniref:alginate lyase family protein n=1 Tax=Petrimonas sp. TaxID=2023866 RepID=UPI003F50F184
MSILRFFLISFFLVNISHVFCVNSLSDKHTNYTFSYADSLNILLDRLDLITNADLNRIKKIQEKDLQEKELLNYFRTRKHINHPVDRGLKSASFGKIASKNDFEVANDALEHIFVGQSAYPRFFCGDDIDWGSRPVPDNEWVWQLNRMSFWNSMGRVYWHTLDEKYAKAWGYQLMDWVRKNPNDNNHRYAWRSIEAGIRGNSWIELYQRFIDSPSFTPQLLITFLNSLYDHASFLMTKYTSNSNWGLMEAEGMAAIGIIFPEFKDSKLWREEAFRRLNIEIDKQVYPDGHQRELAMGYHVGCINWFLRTYQLAEMNGLRNVFPKSYIDRIEKMCEVPMKLNHPDGTTVQFGDAWTGTPGQYNSRFLEWSNLFDRDDFLYLATDGVKGVKPHETAYALPQSGLYSMRSDWNKEAISLTLKCGPDGGGHSQPDNGTFSLYAGGRILMPDAGSYIYSGDPEWRSWFRQTKVHQTITLNNENSNYAPKLVYWDTKDNLDVLVVENKSYDDLTHRRSVIFVDKRYFVIVDEAYGTASGNVRLHFQLASGEAVSDQKKYTVRTDFPDGWNVFLKTRNTLEKMELIAEEGWVSHRYTVKERRPAFCFNTVKKSKTPVIRFVTTLIPYNEIKPDIEVKIKNEPKNGVISQMKLEITENNMKKDIEYNL